MRRPLRREDGSVVYNCCWPTPTQSFWDPILAGLMAIFFCLRFEIPPTWRAKFRIYIPRNRVTQLYIQALGSLFVASYDSQCYGGGIRTRLHTGGNYK
jgi:hypothetical protein